MIDGQAYITVKKARIARAGKQVYSAKELAAQGITLQDGKTFGVVYRPPEVLIKNKDKFANVPFVNDHTPGDVTPDNWKDYAIGFVSGGIGVEVVDDEIWVTGDVVFYDRTAYEAYKNGKVELSAGYDIKLGVVQDAKVAGYDVVLLDIPKVNHVALCDMARAGHNARVLDSLKIFERGIGGFGMAEKTKILGGFLSLFGIGKSKDESFKFSKVLMDSIAKMGTLDAEGINKEVAGVMSHVASFGDSDERGLLIGAITDCFKHPVEVLAQREVISVKLDELYGKCQDAETAAVARILDEGKKDGDGEDEDDKKGGSNTANDAADIPAIVDAAVTKALGAFSDNISALVDTAVRKNLGLDDDEKGKEGIGDNRQMTDSAAGEDASWLLKGVFGQR